MGMRTCESRCLFSGSKGEVCCVEPLHAGPELKDHPITQYSLLAMASLTKYYCDISIIVWMLLCLSFKCGILIIQWQLWFLQSKLLYLRQPSFECCDMILSKYIHTRCRLVYGSSLERMSLRRHLVPSMCTYDGELFNLDDGEFVDDFSLRQGAVHTFILRMCSCLFLQTFSLYPCHRGKVSVVRNGSYERSLVGVAVCGSTESNQPCSGLLCPVVSGIQTLEADPSKKLQFDFFPLIVQPYCHTIINPIYCFGAQVKKDESGTIHVIKQRQLQLNCDLINLSRQMSCCCLYMVVKTLNHYSSVHLQALVGEKTCYQSVCSYAGQIMYLGTKSVHIMTLRNWRERVEHLLKQEKFMEALSLAWSFHEGTAKAVLGLFADPAKRKGVVADKMVEMLLQYVDRSLKKCPEQGKIQVMEQHFQDMVPVMVDYCLLLQRTPVEAGPSLLFKDGGYGEVFAVGTKGASDTVASVTDKPLSQDLLFNQIYPRLVENSVARGVFLESLEPYILSERIGCLTAPVMRDLLSYFQENGMMDSVEGCLVHMDITNLDIQQVVQMCWDNQLYDAMIYVFNSGMNDYISPMEKLFQAIGPHLQEGKPLTDEHVVMGNKLLVYISCCLAGRAYPLGDIPEDLVPQVKNQVFEFLIRLHSVEAAQEEEVYPYIRTLLHFDTREFLNVLALTFEDFKNDKQALEYQQRIVDILLKVMVDNSDFTPSQVGCLFTFLARQLAKPDNTLFVNRKLFDQVLEFLCSPDDDSRHTERQQVLLELLQVGGVVQFDEGRLLELAEKAEFYQICEFMYEKKHLYDKIVDCYLKDPLRKEELFNYIHNILSMPGYSSEEKHLVWVKALQHIKDLVSLNSAKTAELVAVHFTDEVQSIITSLQDGYLVFQFLKCLLDPSSREGLNLQTVLRLGSDLHELLVDLLCQFSPQNVISFLKTSQDYRLEEAIQITEKHNLHEATAFLLERKGDVQGAFEVLLQTLKGKLHKLALKGSEADKPDDDEEEETGNEVQSLLQIVDEALHDIIALCQRSSHGLNQQQREALWFPLLEAMMSPQKLLKGADAKHTSDALKELTMKVLNSMSSFIAPPAIIQRILQDPVYGKGKLAEIQGLILGMLETFNYEQTLLETTTNLLNSDLHWSLSHLRKAVSRGLHPRQDHCNICLQQYKRRQESEEEIIIFSCGHLYHCQCLQRKEAGVLSERQYSWSCYKCTSSQGSRPADRPSAESSRSRSASLAQNKVTSAHRGNVAETHGRKMLTEATLDAQQTLAWDQFRTIYRGPSRLAVLTELTHSHGNERAGLSNPAPPGTGSIYHSENFQLKLSPPPLVEE
ncbi:unnamed protein product [Leuciscus chuanchicus]